MKIERSKILFIGIFLLLTFVLVFFFFQVVFLSEEKRIGRMIHAAQSAFENEDPELLTGVLSKDYQDDMGFDVHGIREGFHEIFSLFEEIKVTLDKMEIAIKDEEAEVQLALWVLAKNEGQTMFLIGSLNNPDHYTLILKKDEGEWKIVRSFQEIMSR